MNDKDLDELINFLTDDEYETRYVVMVNGEPCGLRHLDPEEFLNRSYTV